MSNVPSSTVQVRRLLKLILFIGMLPIASIIIFYSISARNTALENTRQMLREDLHQLHTQQELFNSNIEFMLFTLAQLIEIRDKDAISCRSVLLQMQSHYPYLENLFLADTSGNIFASAKPFDGPINISTSSLFTHALLSKQAITGSVSFDPCTQERVYPIARAVYDAYGRPVAVLVAHVRTGVALLDFPHLNVPDGSIAALVDHRGNFVYAHDYSVGHSEVNEELEAKLADLWVFSHIMEGDFSSTIFQEDDGDYLFAVERIPHPSSPKRFLTILCSIPLHEVYAKANRDLIYNLFFLGMASVMSFICAGLISQRALIIPLHRLIRFAGTLSQGNLKARTPLAAHTGEIGVLAATLNDMALALQERDLALQKEQQTADDDNKAKSDFLARMSHSIRTPMNSILGMSYLALKTNLSNKQRSYIHKIYSAANTLLGIINDILDFSKIESGELAIEESPFSIEDLLSSTSGLLAQPALDKNLELLFIVGHDVPPTLIGDQLRIGQIIINIANNAIKFTEHGTVTVSCTLSYIDEAARKACIVFMVKDTGMGMTSEQRAKLFKPFTQADGSISRKFGGTGIGLTITKRLVELMRGDIAVSSTPGAGTLVSFSLFLDLHPDYVPPAHDAKPLVGQSALIIDDNIISNRLLMEQLRHLGCEVSRAASLNEAFGLIEQENARFRVVLLNGSLQGYKAEEAVRSILEAFPVGKKPAIFVTINPGMDSLITMKVRGAGATGVLLHPINQEKFPEILQAVLKENPMGVFYELQPRQLLVQDNYKNHEGETPLSGVTILLAEDNPINQQLAVELLHDAGAKLLVANDGEEVMQLLADPANDSAVDLFLLDIEMPRKDGYTTAREIRSNEAFNGVPIIAMTAYAMQSERQRCLDCGMNEHISKPLEVNKFFDTICTWINCSAEEVKKATRVLPPSEEEKQSSTTLAYLQPSKPHESAPLEGLESIPLESASLQSAILENNNFTEPAGTAISTDTPNADPTIAALHGFNTGQAIKRMAGKVDLYKKMLRRFVEGAADLQAEYNKAILEQDAPTAQRVAHTLKGLSASLGADQLSQLAEELEHLHKNGTVPSAKLALPCMNDFADVLEIIHKAFSVGGEEEIITQVVKASPTGAAGNEATPLTAEAVELFTQLKALLDDDDAAAIRFIQENKEGLTPFIAGATLKQLVQAVESFDFEAALALLPCLESKNGQ